MEISWFLFIKPIIVLLFYFSSCVDNDATFFKGGVVRIRKIFFIA
jgi:hypothetical protein